MASTVPLRPVLVVEDDEDSRTMLSLILSMKGFRTVAATDGADALRVAHEHHPCLILLDLMMPVMDGEAFRNAQLRDAELKDIPVIVVTARHDGPASAKRMGASSCIGKPLNVQQVLAEVEAHCSKE
jgi:CheY-like chemotaxis protein